MTWNRAVEGATSSSDGFLVVIVVLGHELLGDDQNTILGFLVGHGERTHHPLRDHRLDELGVADHELFGRRQIGQDAGEVFGERRDLLLLEPEADHVGVFSGLQIEDSLTGRADGAGDEAVGVQFERASSRQRQARQVVAGRVRREHGGSLAREPDRGHRARRDDDALEQIEVRPERIGDRGLDGVGV